MAKAKILIVDDDQDIRNLLRIRLKASDYDTVFAADAITAISAARKESPDAIVLDIGLPGGDGYLVMERLKTFPALAHIPVVAVTARDVSVAKDRALAAGALAFVAKPVDNEELLDAVRAALGEEEAQPAAPAYGSLGGR
jgi:DNA-binding response OmpR family regulator